MNLAYWRAFVLALVFLIMVICQLFTFESFDDVIFGLGLPGGRTAAVVLSVLVPLLEVAALPYLLSMKLSVRWRNVSRSAGIAAASVWVLIALWLNISGDVMIENSGLLGATLPTAGGLWLLFVAAMLLWAMLLVARELPPRK